MKVGLHTSLAGCFMIVRADGSALWIGDGHASEVRCAEVAEVAWAYWPTLTDGDGSDGEPVDPELIKELVADTA